MKILINAVSAKRVAGGAFQIALNFINHSFETEDIQIEWYYLVSKDIFDVIQNVMPSIFKDRVYVFPNQPDFKKTYYKVKKKIKKIENSIHPDIIYTITAPSYFRFNTTEVMRFINPWVTHPNKFAWKTLQYEKRLKMKMHCLIIYYLIKSNRFFITQSKTAQQNLIRKLKLPDENVKVVSNVLPDYFKNESTAHVDECDGMIHICSIANNSSHKNLDIIPDVIKILKEKYDISNVCFHLTIPGDSLLWMKIRKKSERYGLMNNIVTHGRISQSELASIYRKCEFAFLPSLLETFSASTIEAMFFNLITVATDFDFNRNVLNNACIYFSPMNAEDAAEKLYMCISMNDIQKNEIHKKMKQVLNNYSNYSEHYEQTVTFLKEVFNR